MSQSILPNAYQPYKAHEVAFAADEFISAN